MLAESVHERPWPRDDWDHADLSDAVDVDRLDGHIDRCVHDADEFGMTLALVVVHGGRIVRERYGPETDADTTLISWSMAKSITHALVGLLVEDGRLELSAPAPIGAWSYDERAEITLQQLLEMSSGLEFVEDYVDAGVSHVIEMLFGSGIDDHAAYASAFPLVAPPGTVWNYSSGTTNIVAKIAGDAIGGGRDGTEKYLRDRLFGPLGMTSATPKFDTAGTFVGSSYVYATARDFARFGYLYLRDGWWDGRRLLPERLGRPRRDTGRGADAGRRASRLRRALVALAAGPENDRRARLRGPAHDRRPRPRPRGRAAGDVGGRTAPGARRCARRDRGLLPEGGCLSSGRRGLVGDRHVVGDRHSSGTDTSSANDTSSSSIDGTVVPQRSMPSSIRRLTVSTAVTLASFLCSPAITSHGERSCSVRANMSSAAAS